MRIISSRRRPFYEGGVLLIVVLVILLVTTILGVSAMDAAGLEMQMSSNSREQQLVFEAAEFAVVEIANEIRAQGGFSNDSIANHNCANHCFDNNCTDGYCFFGSSASDSTSWKTCTPGLPMIEPSQSAALWADNSGRHNKLLIPAADITVRYVIEFRCYAAIDDSLAMDDANNAKVFRITTLVTSKSERAKVMLRVAIKNV